MSNFPIPEPLTGDPDTLSEFARKYHNLSEALKSAAAELATLANADITVSLAVDKIRAKAGDAYVDTMKVSQRYEDAASTYSTYAAKLRDAQQKAERARATVAGFKGSADHATKAREAIISQAMFSLPNQQTADDLNQANAALEPYNTEYAAAMQQYNLAVAEKADAVSAAISQLDDADKSSGLKDTVWQGIQAQARDAYDWLKANMTPLLKAIRAVAKIIASILDVVAFFVSIVNPVVGRAIAAVSLALNALALLCSTILFLTGGGSIGDVIADTIGVAVAAIGVLLPLGGAKSLLSPVTKKVAVDLGKDAGMDVAGNVAGTFVKALPGSSATYPDSKLDVTSRSWNEPPAAPMTSIEDGAGAGLEDIVQALPGADIVLSGKDLFDVVGSFSGTGS